MLHRHVSSRDSSVSKVEAEAECEGSQIYVQPAVTFWNSVLCPQCTFMFRLILAINIDYLFQQIDCVCNGDVLCLLCGRK